MALVFVLAACDRPAIRPVPRANSDQTSANVILIGRIVDAANVGGPRKYDDGGKLYLTRVSVAVETILKGALPAGNATVYYFVPATSYVGPPRLWYAAPYANWQGAGRIMFFLNRESGVLHTICDFYRHCVVRVGSGAHPDFKPDPTRPLADSLIDVLLTRGQGCSDEQMVQAVLNFNEERFDLEYSYRKVRQLAAQETPPVRKAACEWLSRFKQPCVASP